MGLLDKFKRKVETTLSESRQDEELIYKDILKEMDSGVIREGLYAKALANSKGDETQANALYMKYRLRSIKDEMEGSSYLEYIEKIKQEEKLKAEPQEKLKAEPTSLELSAEAIQKNKENRHRIAYIIAGVSILFLVVGSFGQ